VNEDYKFTKDYKTTGMTYNTYKSKHYVPTMGINACSRLT